MLLSVIVPVYNERQTIAEVLTRISLAPFEKEIIVVDDGSSDGTSELLKALDCERRIPSTRYLFHNRNQGKGAALRTAFASVRGDIVLTQDADFEYDPAEYPVLIEPIMSGQADVVYGSRFLTRNGQLGAPHRFHYAANKLLTTVSNTFTNLNLTDMETGFKVFRRDVISRIKIQENRFGFEPEITAKIARLGIHIQEVPVSYRGRKHSEGKKITWRDGIAALVCIVRYRFF